MNAKSFKRLINIYPPYLGDGVRVRSVAPDYRHIRVEMRLRGYNRNYVGTHFGGSIYSMVDPSRRHGGFPGRNPCRPVPPDCRR
jgi:hypothetical protein